MSEDSVPRVSAEDSAVSTDASHTRQRKKRKWDQPAESLVNYPLGNMASLAGISSPGVAPVVPAAVLTNLLVASSATVQTVMLQGSLLPKLNQPKIQDELIIAREIVINDAEPSVRYKLTKRQTQEEIQKCTGAVVITRGMYHPPNVPPDGEKPLYLHISAGAHLKETAERILAVDRAAAMVEEMLKQGHIGFPSLQTPMCNGVQTLSACVFLGFEADQSLNIAARIRGPNDQYINHIMNETGATVLLRGRGSGYFEGSYVAFAFCLAFSLGALKGLLVCPVAGLILIIGNVGVILGLFPAHVAWTVYTLYKTNRLDTPLKVAILFALPALFGLWLGLSIAGSVLVGVGYGFFTPWVSAFEAFRHDNECRKLFHCVVDGTWGTIKGSCTMVRDFADVCYHSYPIFLKELRESPHSNEIQPLRLIHVPGCIIVGLMGLVVDIPLYTVIAVIKSPYMLFKGWFRLLHDLISREGPFLETACIPVAGLTILLWPIVVIGSVLIAIFSSIFIGLYGSIIVYQERSFRRGAAYVIAMVAEFDEYTNDWLYLREGTILPKPRYRQKKVHSSSELSVGGNQVAGGKFTSVSAEAPAMLMPSLAHSRSVREAIQEVKVVQIWVNMMRSCETRGRELLDANVVTPADLNDWLKAKTVIEEAIVGIGLPCYSFLQTLLYSIKAGSGGLLLLDSVEITYLNRPNNKLLDWFFNPIMVLKEQIRVLNLTEPEVRYLEKVVLFGSDAQRMEAWDNGSLLPEDTLRAAQIQGISRRMIGLIRNVTKFPTYRRRFRHVVKALVSYSERGPEATRSSSIRSFSSIENV